MVGALSFLPIFLIGLTSGQCPMPCSDCKEFNVGEMCGLPGHQFDCGGRWKLQTPIPHPRCIQIINKEMVNVCMYKREEDNKEYCFCDPGNSKYEQCPRNVTTQSSTSEEKKVFKTVVVENGETIEQIDTFYPDTGEISLSVPAHGNFGEATIIMDRDSKVLMKSTQNTCYIESLPDGVDPNDIKTKMDEESESTEPITEDMEKKIYSLVIDAGTASADEITHLSPAMKKECANKTIKKTEQKDVDKETFNSFTNGKVITVRPQSNRKRRDVTVCENPSEVCSRRPDDPNHCWRWTYGSLSVRLHSLSVNVICVRCCNSISDTSTDLCPCNELTSLEKIKECSNSCPEQDIGYHGVRIKNGRISGIANWKECQKYCVRYVLYGCSYWSYVPKNIINNPNDLNRCYLYEKLKKEKPNKFVQKGTVSGPAKC